MRMMGDTDDRIQFAVDPRSSVRLIPITNTTSNVKRDALNEPFVMTFVPLAP